MGKPFVILIILFLTMFIISGIKVHKKTVNNLNKQISIKDSTIINQKNNILEKDIKIKEYEKVFDEIESINNKILYIKKFSNSSKLAKAIYFSSKEHNIDSDLLISIAFNESSFKKYAISNKECIGYFQINPNAHDVNLDLIYDEYYNAYYGGIILRKYLDQYNNNKFSALCAYNAGPTGFNKNGWGKKYAYKVIKLYKKLDNA